MGGVAKAATKEMKATAKGENFKYGIVTKVKVTKNQLPVPWNVTYEGTMCCVHNGIISEKDIDNYKKDNIKLILEKLASQCSKNNAVENPEITEADVQFTEEESFDE